MIKVTPSRVALLLFGSGLCSLVYQVAWLRQLRLVFGASTAASAAVLAIFMAGLGLGGWLLGRRVDRHPRPLAFYGWLEVAIALAAAISPLAVLGVRNVYVALGGTAGLGDVFGTLVRLLLAGLVLGIPTFLMGGTLPAVSRAVEERSDRGRRSVALLYGANTLGAVTGAALTTFVSLELLGVTYSILAATVLNLLVAGMAVVVGRRQEPLPVDAPDRDTPRATTGRSTGKSSQPPLRFVLAAAALVGFAFFLMEIVWYRMLGPILGGSSYTFGLILAVALLGIGVGGFLYAAGAEGRRPTLATFATTCSLEALFLILPFALGDHLATLALLLRPLGDVGFGLLVASWSLITAIVVLPTAIVAGYQFPLLVAVLGSGREAVGREVGLTYAWNTVGAIAGSIAGGFGLLPVLTAPGTWRLLGFLLIGLAVVALVVHRRSRPNLLPVAAGLAALVLCFTAGPGDFWRHSPIGAGRLQATFADANDLRRLVEERRLAIVWEAEGVESSIAVDSLNQIMFTVNGKTDGSALRDAPNMVMSVLVGAALHPEPKQSLVIGLGTGTSAGWLAEVPTMERVEVVELEPATAHVAEITSAVNFDVLHHPKVDMIWGDGRELLLTADRQWDLVFSQPSNPYRAGIASLFSREFYQAVAERLAPQGLLLQWLQGYETDGHVVRMAYATLRSVFPHVESWQVHHNDLLLVASLDPVVHDPDELARRMAREPWASGLERTWGVQGLEGLYAGYLGAGGLADALVEQHDGGLNTDDHPRMEFGFVRNLGREGLFDVESLRRLARAENAHRPPLAPGTSRTVDWQRSDELRTVSQLVWGGLPNPSAAPDADTAARIRARRAYRRNQLSEALAEWRSQSSPPVAPMDHLLLAEGLAEAADPSLADLAGDLARQRPEEAAGVLARWSLRRGDPTAAAEHLEELFLAARENPWVDLSLLARSLLLTREVAARDAALARRLFRILEEPFEVRMLDELRHRMRVDLAARVPGDPCVEAFAPFEPHPPWEGHLLVTRSECYQRHGHPRAEDAAADLARYRSHAPPALEEGLVPREVRR